MPLETLGLIAGNGKFPFLFAQAARKKGLKVIAAGIRGDTSGQLRFLVDRFRLFQVGELRPLFSFLKSEGAVRIIMAGQVSPRNLFNEKVKLDKEFQALYDALSDRKADTIFSAIADKLRAEGMELLDSTFLIEDYLAPKGTLTKRGPTVRELEDINFGIKIAKEIGAVDIGQTVVVKEKAILAVEAMEGTDRAILRGGKIAGNGAVVIKVSKPKQDLRFDVPVIGPRTVRMMAKSRASCLAVEAGKTLVIDQDICVKLANKAKICLVAA
ncbi:MAG: UDP-2,3-diacylglucosamine diphosphatase LpxI [Candidatus Omnitrophota bacterium]